MPNLAASADAFAVASWISKVEFPSYNFIQKLKSLNGAAEPQMLDGKTVKKKLALNEHDR